MVWRCEIKTEQPKDRCDQPFGLAERQAENRPQRQRRRDRQRRVARLAAARGSAFHAAIAASVNQTVKLPALAQGEVIIISCPIRHSVPLLRDAYETNILVDEGTFQLAQRCRRSRDRFSYRAGNGRTRARLRSLTGLLADPWIVLHLLDSARTPG
jgi:hypothetical protein